jgi:hypothetical protein
MILLLLRLLDSLIPLRLILLFRLLDSIIPAPLPQLLFALTLIFPEENWVTVFYSFYLLPRNTENLCLNCVLCTIHGIEINKIGQLINVTSLSIAIYGTYRELN